MAVRFGNQTLLPLFTPSSFRLLFSHLVCFYSRFFVSTGSFFFTTFFGGELRGISFFPLCNRNVIFKLASHNLKYYNIYNVMIYHFTVFDEQDKKSTGYVVPVLCATYYFHWRSKSSLQSSLPSSLPLFLFQCFQFRLFLKPVTVKERKQE